MAKKILTTPIKDEDLADIKAGDIIYLNGHIVTCRDVAMPETLWVCRVKEFGPLIVSIDTHGNNLFEQNKVIFNQRKEIVADEICKHVSFIK
ncbi:MAG: hypothetical protein E7L38_06425 [Klebsiella pneumoniae]|nr:hypothetical protein [Klebsiella pneumoniae]